MFHDAPVEAVEAPSSGTVHRRPKRAAGGCDSDVARLQSTYQLDRVVDFILTYKVPLCTDDSSDGVSSTPELAKAMLKVALQFPDTMLDDATAVVHELESCLKSDPRYPVYQASLRDYHAYKEQQPLKTPATGAIRGGALPAASLPGASMVGNPNAPTDRTRLFVLADNTFGSCCPDEITALHYDSDCIIHFGEACMSKSTRLPVLYIHPPMHFNAVEQLRRQAAQAVAAEPSCTSGDEPMRQFLFSRGEVHLLAEAIRRVRAAIARRRNDWEQNVCSGGGGGPTTICPRLVIVGTPSTASLLDQVRHILSSREAGNADMTKDEVVPVDWCSFVEGSVVTAGGSGTTTRGDADTADTWVVNGARFPRLKHRRRGQVAAAGAAVGEMQHFLFVGPSTASHPVHLHGIHQYNCFHYPPVARGYFEDDNDVCDCDASGHSTYAPALFVIDENFAVAGSPSDGCDEGSSHCRVLGAEASEEEAHEFLNCVFGDDAQGALATDTVAQSACALSTVHRRLNQRSFNIEAVRASSAVGILVASLAIEGYYECTMLLHRLLRSHGKRSYVLYVGHLNEFKLANFADTVDCFVVVACPNARHCHFPEKSDNYMKRVVSPAEVLLALTADPSAIGSDSDNSGNDSDAQECGKATVSSRQLYGMPGLYSTEFMCILEPLRAAVAQRQRVVAAAEGGAQQQEEQWRDSAALIHMNRVGGGALMATNDTVQGALARLHERKFVGLDPQIGQTEVQMEILQGKHGIARGYAAEREGQQEE